MVQIGIIFLKIFTEGLSIVNVPTYILLNTTWLKQGRHSARDMTTILASPEDKIHISRLDQFLDVVSILVIYKPVV